MLGLGWLACRVVQGGCCCCCWTSAYRGRFLNRTDVESRVQCRSNAPVDCCVRSAGHPRILPTPPCPPRWSASAPALHCSTRWPPGLLPAPISWIARPVVGVVRQLPHLPTSADWRLVPSFSRDRGYLLLFGTGWDRFSMRRLVRLDDKS
jgi:hypothetical protein